MDPRLSARDARLLLMQAQGLLDDPDRKATPARVARLIDTLGFVQVDSINVVERAHHLTLAARLHGYRPRQLRRLHEERALFEHWTHDASLIPIGWYRHWKPRFARFRDSLRTTRWIRHRMGPEPEKVIARVRRRLRREGPLMARDFELPEGVARESWWGWTPAKTALEYLWLTGEATIAARRHFHKVYDLTERALPEVAGVRRPGPRQQVEWACASALERLVVASHGEIAAFWQAVSPAESSRWCRDAERAGRIVAVQVEDARGGRHRPAWALPDWEARLARAPAPPDGLRLLGPFDPVVRDRRRLERRFGFDYRFEAFVPARKRRFGYYVLPILEGDRFVGRLDPKLHRDRATLEVKRLHWEPDVRATAARRRALEDAVSALAGRVGADTFELPRA